MDVAMSEEDMSSLLKQFSTMMNNNTLPDNVKDVLHHFQSSSETGTSSNASNENSAEENSNNSSTMPNIDIEMLLKLKSIIDKVNTKNDPRTNLLLSLKPYLNDTRKGKLEQYMQFLNLSKVLEAFNSTGGDKNRE